MKPDTQSYAKLFSYGLNCERPIGGNCVGNCRVLDNKLLSCGFDCERPIGGNCVGNCRVFDNTAASLVW
ncbi:MAG: hypothetical protein IJS99_07935 [Synergistaceae bacterium]|nr:hypothetical protein [Synergistaceae bacterium]